MATRRIPPYVDTDPAPDLPYLLDEYANRHRDHEDALRDVRDGLRSLAASGIGSASAILASGSTTARSLASRFSETKNILDYGADAAASDNTGALLAAVEAARVDGGGTVLVPSGVFRYTGRIGMRDNVSIVGYGHRSILYYDPPNSGSVVDRFGFAWEGVLLDYPTRRPLGDEHPLALIGIDPAAAGDMQIVANPSGGLEGVAAGDWIILAEGSAPKWNNRLQYVRVVDRVGDTVTLNRPLDFAFDGSSGAGVSFGVERIDPVENAWISDVTLRTGQYAVFGPVGTSLAVRGGLEGCIIDPLFDGSNPFFNDAYQFRIRGNIFTRGQIGGFNRSSYSSLLENIFPAVGAADQEYGEGASFNVIAFNLFSGHTGLNPLLGIGKSFHLDVSHNSFSNVKNNSSIKVVGAKHGTISFNRFSNARVFPIALGTINGYSTGNVTEDWTVIGNHLSLAGDLPNDLSAPAVAVHAYPNVVDVSIVDNWVDHPIKIGTGSQYDDQRGIFVYGNRGPGAEANLEPTRLPFGRAAISAAYKDTPTDSFWNGNTTGKSWDPGELVYKFDPNAAGLSQGFYVISGGTTGTALSGVTGTIASGSVELTVNDASRLLPGSYIAIAGVGGARRIVSVAGLVLTLSAAADASVSDAAVAWSAPGWVRLPSQAAAQGDSSASDVPGVVSDFNALLAKLRSAGVVGT